MHSVLLYDKNWQVRGRDNHPVPMSQRMVSTLNSVTIKALDYRPLHAHARPKFLALLIQFHILWDTLHMD